MALSKESDLKIRKKAINLIKSGKSKKFISEKLGIDVATVYRWEIKYNKDNNWLKVGTLKGRNSKLNAEISENILVQLLIEPNKYGYEINLWSTSKIQSLLRKTQKLEVSQDLVIRYLNKIQIKFKRPSNNFKKEILRDNPQLSEWISSKKPIFYYNYFSDLNFKQSIGPPPNSTKKIYCKLVINPSGQMFFRLYEKKISLSDEINFWNEIIKYHNNRKILGIYFLENIDAKNKILKKNILNPDKIQLIKSNTYLT